ncbi:VanW family protein [Mesobacillus maritimus]|uniref:G5 domain-containing protein n=1 Tax=Mesobacillus maritimus TaxID=1643336 RepID=UPI00203B6AE8|nr:VanW family protein [Mesobacillus maritimus]
MKNQQGIKLFVVLLVSTLFIYSFSHFGALTYHAMTNEDNLFSIGTTIASVDVTGQTTADALIALTEQRTIWQNGTTISLKYKEKSVPVNLEIYHFDLQGSIDSAISGQSNPVITTINDQDVATLMDQLTTSVEWDDEAVSKIKAELLTYGTNFTAGENEVVVEKVLEAKSDNKVISETVLELKDVSVAMMDWVSGLSPIVLPSKTHVSMLTSIEEKKLTSMPENVKSMIATAIYQTVLPTNFEIIERNISQQLPAYTELGFEAKVSAKHNLDLVIGNPNETEYKLEFKWNYPTLTVQLKGNPLLYNYEILPSNIEEYKQKTIVQYSPNLQPGNKTVKEAGKSGFQINIVRKVYGENGEFLYEEVISEDFYSPIERVEVHGLAAGESTEKTQVTEKTTKTTEENSQSETVDRTNKSEPESETEVTDDLDTEKIKPKPAEEIWGNPKEKTK